MYIFLLSSFCPIGHAGTGLGVTSNFDSQFKYVKTYLSSEVCNRSVMPRSKHGSESDPDPISDNEFETALTTCDKAPEAMSMN